MFQSLKELVIFTDEIQYLNRPKHNTSSLEIADIRMKRIDITSYFVLVAE